MDTTARATGSEQLEHDRNGKAILRGSRGVALHTQCRRTRRQGHRCPSCGRANGDSAVRRGLSAHRNLRENVLPKNKRHQRSARWMICIPAHVWQTLRWQLQGRVRRVLLAQLMRSKIRLTSRSSGSSAQSWSNGVINLSQPLNCAADSNSIS